MSSPNVQLHPVDLSVNPSNTLAAVVRLLAPHVPYSLYVLGIIINTGSRPSTLQDIDPSKLSLWSTIPLHSDAIPITDHPALFSLVVFSPLISQFRFFCSAESHAPADAPTEADEAHVKQVFECLREMANAARPTYDSVVIPVSQSGRRPRVDGTDPSMIVIGAVHEKWAGTLAPVSICQNPIVLYVFPRGALRCLARAPDVAGEAEVEAPSEIRPSDFPFVRGASPAPRSEAYLSLRAPYSVCIRSRARGQPAACALLHLDGSIGSVHVDPEYRRQGLGGMVIRALMDKLDFGQGRDDVASEDRYRWHDLGGGALGWNWTGTSADDGVANRFFTSLAGGQGKWTCCWMFMLVNPNLLT